jgi:REP element-mobilizing transposase RayT
VQSITFRLHDSVPDAVIAAWRHELKMATRVPADDPRSIELRRRIERYIDKGHGACWLREAGIAGLVQGALLHFDGERYRMLAWCVMPNHVHCVVAFGLEWRMDQVVHSWKSFTSHHGAVKALGISGRFWARDYFDRYIRDEEHLERAIAYVEFNPVRAGLVKDAAKWPWSSAAVRATRKRDSDTSDIK